MNGLLDTSVLIGPEADRLLRALPDEAALSVITIEELTLGVRMAKERGETELALRRQRTLDAVLTEFDALPVDRRIATECASIRAAGRRRNIRFAPFDSLIAATAVVSGLPLYTHDTQFTEMPGVDVRLV